MPLTHHYTSSIGIHSSAYHVLTSYKHTPGNAFNTVVSGSVYTTVKDYEDGYATIGHYTYRFNYLMGSKFSLEVESLNTLKALLKGSLKPADGNMTVNYHDVNPNRSGKY